MADAGWMNDPSDPALARWFDGTGWTEHTLVKAEWLGSGPPPPPGVEDRIPAFAAAVPASEPTLPQPTPAAPPSPPVKPSSIVARAGDRYKGWPLWARITAPTVAALLLIGALGGGRDDKKKDEIKTTPAASVTLEDAVDLAQAELASPIPARTMRDLVQGLCDVDVGNAAAAAAATSEDPAVLSDVIDASGKGASELCPAVADDHPALVNDVYVAAAALQLAATTTTQAPATTAPTTIAPSATQAPATTRAVATTTKPTATTIKAVTTTVPSSGGAGGAVTAGSFCSPEGSTGVTSTGLGMTCSGSSCAGEPYTQPRWHKTVC